MKKKKKMKVEIQYNFVCINSGDEPESFQETRARTYVSGFTLKQQNGCQPVLHL